MSLINLSFFEKNLKKLPFVELSTPQFHWKGIYSLLRSGPSVKQPKLKQLSKELIYHQSNEMSKQYLSVEWKLLFSIKLSSNYH